MLNNETNTAVAASATSALHAWLALDGARLLCAPDGRVLWQNPPATQILNRCPTVALRDGVLCSAQRGQGPALPDLLAGASDRIASHVVGGVEGDDDVVLITVRTVMSDGAPLRGVTLRWLNGRPRIAWPDLSHVHRLTAAERRIAQGMAEGDTAEAIADRTHLSVETVRTHVRHIYSKLGVSSREGLFARLIPYMVWDE